MTVVCDLNLKERLCAHPYKLCQPGLSVEWYTFLKNFSMPMIVEGGRWQLIQYSFLLFLFFGAICICFPVNCINSNTGRQVSSGGTADSCSREAMVPVTFLFCVLPIWLLYWELSLSQLSWHYSGTLGMEVSTFFTKRNMSDNFCRFYVKAAQNRGEPLPSACQDWKPENEKLTLQ